jgi:hypothetical protein
MNRRLAGALGVMCTAACSAGLFLSLGSASAAPGASAAGSLPTLNLALAGTKGIVVSGSEVSGAVNVVSTYTGKGQGSAALIRLDPGVSFQQAFNAVQSHHGNLDALTPYGRLFFDATAPSHTQTVLTPGHYVALNVTGNGAPAFQQFDVSASSSPAKLPAAREKQTAIEFGFRGPRKLHNGTMVRAVNGGYLVHMIVMVGVKNAATGKAVMVLLRAGKDHAAEKLASHNFVNLLGPASPGAMQQSVLHAKRGYYVEACFMDTTDHREHTRLGMERLVRVVK